MAKWEPSVPFVRRGENGYYLTSGMGGFVPTAARQEKTEHRIWYAPRRRLYEVNIDTGECSEAEIVFDYEELKAHASGFGEESEWMRYCLNESAFNSLKDFLDNRITGEAFDRERQLKAFSEINAAADGTCGARIHRFVKGKI